MTSGSCSKRAVTSSSRASVVWFPILFDITSLRGTVHSWCAQLREREPVRAWRGCGCKDWDVLIVGAGESLLGLHHLDGVCHAGSEAVFRPGEALIGKCDTLLGDFHLLFRGIQVEKCSAYVVVNLAANVLGFGFALSARRSSRCRRNQRWQRLLESVRLWRPKGSARLLSRNRVWRGGHCATCTLASARHPQ